MMVSPAHVDRSPAYRGIESRLASEECVILDGAIGTELPQVADSPLDERLWGTQALVEAPGLVGDVHRRYVKAGCDVVTTNTWGLAAALDTDFPLLRGESDAPLHWMDIARRGLRLACEAVDEELEAGSCAVAFSLNGEIISPHGRETVQLLSRLFAGESRPPDLILIETLSVLPPALFETVEELVATGIPIWLSFRRCRYGLCGVYGQHWGGPEGDSFGRAARRFEEMGVEALLVNCIPPDHVDGMVTYLRDFTDLPLGVYPNLGYLTEEGWQFDPGVGGTEYAEASLRWRQEGAQIVGGCCGTRPEHISAARERLVGTKPGHRRVDHAQTIDWSATEVEPWRDNRGRILHPLPFPFLTIEPGVEPPAEPSFMAWEHLFREGIGAHQRCLDVGCGSGLLGIQLALNGARHVHAIDIDARAVENTRANAFRNGVDERVSAEAVDLYPWIPDERYEVIVASVSQLPTDPFEVASTHREVDYWGRAQIDQLITKLESALAPEGVAYVVHVSILSQRRTAALLEASGMDCRVVQVDLSRFLAKQEESMSQIQRVEELSDGFHVDISGQPVMVSYLLEISQKAAAQ